MHIQPTDQPLDPRLPTVAHAAEVVGGPDDGTKVGLIRSDECALMLVMDLNGHVSMQTCLDPETLLSFLNSLVRDLAAAAS